MRNVDVGSWKRVEIVAEAMGRIWHGRPHRADVPVVELRRQWRQRSSTIIPSFCFIDPSVALKQQKTLAVGGESDCSTC